MKVLRSILECHIFFILSIWMELGLAPTAYGQTYLYNQLQLPERTSVSLRLGTASKRARSVSEHGLSALFEDPLQGTRG
jgi:hypothetical protein